MVLQMQMPTTPGSVSTSVSNPATYSPFGAETRWRNKRSNCLTCPHRASEWCALGEDLVELNEAKTSNTYQPGQAIFYQGNPCMGIYCIEEGTVALRKCDAQGNEVIVRLVHTGEVLGARTFFTDSEYSASAVALTPTRVCFVDKNTAKRLLSNNTQVNQAFLKTIAQALHQAEEDKLHFATLSVRARLAHLLLKLKDRYGRVDNHYTLFIELPLSRQDMASMIATRPETLSRTIRSMEKDGVVKFSKRAVKVPDLDALMDELEKNI